MISLLVIADSRAAGLYPLRDMRHAHIRWIPDPSSLDLDFVLDPAEGLPPELIVTFEARPGELAPGVLRKLRELFPFARIWRVLGTWCEGEARSGRPPGGCLAAYDHQFLLRLNRELNRVARGQAPLWHLPPTASAEEQLLAATPGAPGVPADCAASSLAIRGTSAAGVAALVGLCRQSGFAARYWPPQERAVDPAPQAILWDTTPPELHDARAIAQARGPLAEVPLVAIAGFPRPADVEAARKAGVAAVVAKPLLAADLADTLQQAARLAADRELR